MCTEFVKPSSVFGAATFLMCSAVIRGRQCNGRNGTHNMWHKQSGEGRGGATTRERRGGVFMTLIIFHNRDSDYEEIIFHNQVNGTVEKPF